MNVREREYPAVRDIAAATAMLAGLVVSPLAHAAWDVVPRVQLSATSEDNPRMDYEDAILLEQDYLSTAAVLEGSLNVETYNARGFFRITPSFTSYRYSDERDSELESDDPYFSSDGSYSWETVTAGFSLRYAQERLLNSEFVSVEPDNDPDTPDPDVGDTGRLVFIDEQHERFLVQPFLAFRVSERNTFRLDYMDYESSYSAGDLSFRTGYSDRYASASLIRNVDQRNSVSAVMTFEDYKADVNSNSFKTATIEGDFTRPITELWAFTLGVGVLRSDFVVVDSLQREEDGATTDYIARIGLRKRSERARLNLDFARDVYPSGSGYVSVRREIRFYLERDMTQRLTGSFGTLFQESETLGELNTFDNRNYGRIEVGFQWAIKPTFFLITGVDYKAQEFTDELVQRGKTDSTGVFIGVAYQGKSKPR